MCLVGHVFTLLLEINTGFSFILVTFKKQSYSLLLPLVFDLLPLQIVGYCLEIPHNFKLKEKNGHDMDAELC